MEPVKQANIDKAFIDASPSGLHMVTLGVGDYSHDDIDQALFRLVDRVQSECHLLLQPLRLIVVTENLGEAANFWNRELGSPEAGVSDGAVGKYISWGNDLDSARSIVILPLGISHGVASGLSIAITSVIHELGHVHDDFVRGVKFGFRQHSNHAGDWPAICAQFAEITWSEYAAETVAVSYMTAEDLQTLMTNDPAHLASTHQQLRELIRCYQLRQLDLGSLWSQALTHFSHIFANLGRAAARFPFAENGKDARAGLVNAAGEAAPWQPIVEEIFGELDALADKAYSGWAGEPFRGIGEQVAAGFNAAGFFPIPCGQNLRVNVS
jgi:hypothetical protein